MLNFRTSVRTRVVAIALVPSVVLVLVVGVVSYRSVGEGLRDRKWADENIKSSPDLVEVTSALQVERGLTLLRVGGKSIAPGSLVTARTNVDLWMKKVADSGSVTNLKSSGTEKLAVELGAQKQKLAVVRARVDIGTATVDEAYEVFNPLLSIGFDVLGRLGRMTTDIDVAVVSTNNLFLYQAIDAMARAHALAVATISDGSIPANRWREFVRQVDIYRGQLERITPALSEQARGQLERLTTSPTWAELADIEDAVIAYGARDGSRSGAAGTAENGAKPNTPLVLDVVEWEKAVNDVETGLLGVWRGEWDRNHRQASVVAEDAAEQAILSGAAVALLAVAVSLFSLLLSNRLSRRLRRLHTATLSATDEALPRLMARIQDGEIVDLTSEIERLDFGHDEIGQVADAFNKAQTAAVAAAMTEARTRSAANAVFVNIANRSQVIAHRQLELLDKAEAHEENPGRLDLLFKLDHLATRGRRNAENLIILGGERPGRRWTRPVPLMEVIRSAMGETQDFGRISVGRMPEVRIAGAVVADVSHLVAELFDNATFFSPPDSPVDANGSRASNGVVVEIVDRGLGMTEEALRSANELLTRAPDLGIISLSSDSRLGLIVVATLAAQGGIRVTLRESDYGGVRAIILIPDSMIETAANEGPQHSYSLVNSEIVSPKVAALPRSPLSPDGPRRDR